VKTRIFTTLAVLVLTGFVATAAPVHAGTNVNVNLGIPAPVYRVPANYRTVYVHEGFPPVHTVPAKPPFSPLKSELFARDLQSVRIPGGFPCANGHVFRKQITGHRLGKLRMPIHSGNQAGRKTPAWVLLLR